MIRVSGGIAVSGRIGGVAGGARLAGCGAVRRVAVAVVLRICSGGYGWGGIRRRRHGRGSRVAVPSSVAVHVVLRTDRVRGARVGRRCRIRSDRRARRRGSVVRAGRRRWVAAAGRGRGGGIARGACCGSVPAPVAVAVVRQSKRWRHEESGDSEDADRECEEPVMGASGERRRFARRRADCPRPLPTQTEPQKLPICLSPPRRRVLIRCTIVLLDLGTFNRSTVRQHDRNTQVFARFRNAADN